MLLAHLFKDLLYPLWKTLQNKSFHVTELLTGFFHLVNIINSKKNEELFKCNNCLTLQTQGIKKRITALQMLKKALEEAREIHSNGANAAEILRFLHRYYPLLKDQEVWWVIEQVIKAA